MSGFRLGTRGKELVAHLIEFFEREKMNKGPFISVNAVRERVAAALKLDVSTVSAVSKAVKSKETFKSKKTRRIRKKTVTDVDEFTKCAIRNVIYRMYDNNEHISVHTLWVHLKDAELFNGCEKSLNTLLHNIGFTWKKDDPRGGLMELPNVVFQRLQFLKTYKRIKQEGIYQFVYLDETWIFQNGTISHSWQNNDLRTVKSTRVDGKRQIVLHAGSQTGFIKGSELVFSSSTKNSDYHGEMNEKNFLHWFENQLLKNLKEPSAIVLDNAPYHSSVFNKVPNSNWKKADIAKWLQNEGIEYETNSLKTELLQTVAMNKPPKIYKVDRLAEQYGHKVLRLPPYHCIFNPIEHVWGITKTYYNRHIGREGKSIESCLKMWHEALATATPQVWADSVEHCEKIIDDYWNREIRYDREDVPPFIINVNASDSDSDSDSDSE